MNFEKIRQVLFMMASLLFVFTLLSACDTEKVTPSCTLSNNYSDSNPVPESILNNDNTLLGLSVVNNDQGIGICQVKLSRVGQYDDTPVYRFYENCKNTVSRFRKDEIAGVLRAAILGGVCY